MKIAIYSRKSKFTGKGDSIGNQIDRCKDYISFIFMEEKDIEIQIFEDEGYSGKNTDRPAFKKMMHMIKMKELDAVVVYQLNRLGRKVKDILEIIDIFKEYKCALHSVTEKIDTSSPMGTMFLTILASISQFERDDMIQRITDNMYLLARDGRWLGGQAPLGFNHVRESFIDRHGKTRYYSSLVVNEEEIDKVIQMFELYLDFESVSRVHKYLLRNKVTGKKGGYINKSSIQSVLSNPTYAMFNEDIAEFLEEQGYIVTKQEHGKGVLTYCKRTNDKTRNNPKIAATSKHDGVIPAEKWIKVQELIARNRPNKPNRGNSNVALLSGVLRCKCGAVMNVLKGQVLKDGTRPYYYACSMKIDSGNTICNMKNLNGAIVDKRIVEEVVGYDSSKVIEELDRILKNDILINNNTEVDQIKNTIEQLKSKKGNMFLQLQVLDSNLDKEIILEYQQIIREINFQIKELEESLNSVIQKDAIIINEEIDIEGMRNKISNFQSTFDILNHEDKKKILKSIFEEIVWDSECNTISITYSSKNLKMLEEL